MKLIIDIPEMAYEAYKEWHKNKVATVEQSIIANGKPYEDRPQGEWIRTALYGMTCYECNRCHLHYDLRSFFCPNCGADMRKDEEE